jgi:hypothetical protein
MIGPGIFTICACSLIFYLFGSYGPILNYLTINLDFLMLPFMGYYILRLFSRLIRLRKSSREWTACALLCNGLASGCLSYGILSQSPLFLRITDLVNYRWLLLDLQKLGIISILFFAGYTVIKLAELLKATSWEPLAFPAVLATGQVMIGVSLWRSLAVFAPSWTPWNGIGLILFAGILAVAFANFGYYGQKSNYPPISGMGNWLKSSPMGMFLIGIMLATYLIFIRPAIIKATPWAFIIEWLLLCFISGIIFILLNQSLEEKYSLPYKESAWQTHVQEIDELIDVEFDKIVFLQGDFVDQSAQNRLREFLQDALQENGLNENEIKHTLTAITEYRDKKIPWWAFGCWEKRYKEKNRENRRRVLSHTMDSVKRVFQPVKIEGEQNERITTGGN